MIGFYCQLDVNKMVVLFELVVPLTRVYNVIFLTKATRKHILQIVFAKHFPGGFLRVIRHQILLNILADKSAAQL